MTALATPLLDELRARAPAAATALGEPALAERTLEAWCTAAAVAWPGVEVAPAAVIALLGDKLGDEDPPGLDQAAVVELHLALGCARGQAAALAAFEREILSVVPGALARYRLDGAELDELRAAVRARLLVADPPGAPPRVVAYAGRGRLRGLVTVTATRLAIDHARRTRRDGPLHDDHPLLTATDADLTLIKAQHRAAFSAALQAAVQALARRDRTLLRLHHLGGVTLEQLAVMYGVHRATVVRWLAAARASVLTGTRDGVRGALGLDDDELDEMFALVQSRVELSLERLLASTMMAVPGDP